jgi:hypothetical protein
VLDHHAGQAFVGGFEQGADLGDVEASAHGGVHPEVAAGHTAAEGQALEVEETGGAFEIGQG